MNKTLPQQVIHHCPKCGTTGFIYRNDNSFVCKSCEFQLYINASAAVAALIIDGEGRLLLTRRAVEPRKGFLDLPGGFVDVMETAESALLREIQEELNLKINKYAYFTSAPNEYIFGGLSVFTLDLAYICGVDSFDGIKASDDVSDFIFMDLNDIPMEEISSCSIKKIIGRYLNMVEQRASVAGDDCNM